MYRITQYKNDDEKVVQETRDEDTMRDFNETCIEDLENGRIKSFVISRVTPYQKTKPWWEK